MDLPVDRFLNFVWYIFTRNLDQKQRMQFELEVNRPIPGLEVSEKTGPWSEEEMGDAFFAAMGKKLK